MSVVKALYLVLPLAFVPPGLEIMDPFWVIFAISIAKLIKSDHLYQLDALTPKN